MPRRFVLPTAFTVLVVALLVILALGVAANGHNNSLDAAVADRHYLPAPDASARLTRLAGSGTESLTNLHGHPVLVDVFASWCVSCQLEAPVMRMAERLLSAQGGTVLGVTYQDNAAADATYVRQYGVRYPVVKDPSGNFAQAFGVSGVPENFMIDAAGKVVAVSRGPVTAAWVRQALSTALSQPA